MTNFRVIVSQSTFISSNEFYNRVLDEGTAFIRGHPSHVIQQNGRLVIQPEDTLADCQRLIPVDVVSAA